MGIAIAITTVFWLFAIAFAYAVKRHYDARLKQIDKDVEMENIRIEHHAKEYTEIYKRMDELEKKFTGLKLNR